MQKLMLKMFLRDWFLKQDSRHLKLHYIKILESSIWYYQLLKANPNDKAPVELGADANRSNRYHGSRS